MSDFRILHGDALTALYTLPTGRVQCVVTSPPYWGLRDYNTARWVGGDASCDHKADRSNGIGSSTLGGGKKDDQPPAGGLSRHLRQVRCAARR